MYTKKKLKFLNCEVEKHSSPETHGEALTLDVITDSVGSFSHHLPPPSLLYFFKVEQEGVVGGGKHLPLEQQGKAFPCCSKG